MSRVCFRSLLERNEFLTEFHRRTNLDYTSTTHCLRAMLSHLSFQRPEEAESVLHLDFLMDPKIGQVVVNRRSSHFQCLSGCKYGTTFICRLF